MASETTLGDNVNRRAFLSTAAAGAAVVAAAPSALAATGSGLSVGTVIGEGWTVAEVTAGAAGAVRVVALHSASGRRANVAVCKREVGSSPIARTEHVDLFLMNDGQDGQRRTPADEVRVVGAIARALDGAEHSLPGAHKMLGRRARQAMFAPIDHLEPIAE